MNICNRTLTGPFSTVMLLLAAALVTGCSSDHRDGRLANPGGSGSSEVTVLTGATLSVESFSAASTTVATSYRRTAEPGDSIKLVSYAFDSNLATPASSGVVEFSAQIETDDVGTIAEVPIGQASVLEGRAEINWSIPTEYFGNYTVKAVFSSDDGFAPSQWSFQQNVSRPNDEGALEYAMARLNHIVNLMNTRSSVDSVFEDGADQNLSAMLLQEFNLEIVSDLSFHRQESGIQMDVRFKDTATFLQSAGTSSTKKVDLCVRTTLFAAANDDVLVIVLKGTDGGPNEDVNNEGSPSSYEPYAENIAVHPGWAWMSIKMIDGFPNGLCGDNGNANRPYPGLARIIADHRLAPDGTVRRLYLTGHSLGGALARMTAVKMASGSLLPGDRVYTFGAPWQNAYNELFGFSDFKTYASDRFRDNGIRLFRTEGYGDPIPASTENKVRSAWQDSMSSILYWKQAAATLVRAGKCAVDEIKSWFGAGDGCDDNVVGRPIGYDRPRYGSPRGFMSLSHRRLFADGTPAIKRCYQGLVDEVVQQICGTARETECSISDDSCTPLYHKTDIGDFSVLQSRAHWVGDYEYDARLRLRGDPTRYNFYFPENGSGRIRQPIEIIALP